MDYVTWRATFQNSETAARQAFEETEQAYQILAELVSMIDFGTSAEYRALQEHRAMKRARSFLVGTGEGRY